MELFRGHENLKSYCTFLPVPPRESSCNRPVNRAASAAMTATTASENGASSATQLHPSAAQVAIAAKVAASRFCDVLGTDKSRRLFYGTARRRDETGGETGEVEARRKQETCLRLLTTQPAEFLRQVVCAFSPSPEFVSVPCHYLSYSVRV